jgi:hypothetical protein
VVIEKWYAFACRVSTFIAENTSATNPNLNLNLNLNLNPNLNLCSKTAPYLTTATVPERDSERMPALPASPQLHSRT